MELFFVAAIAFVAAFTQSFAGFGTALIAMPLLSPLLGIRIAAALMALISALMQIVLLVRYRNHFNWRETWSLAAASLIGVPLGYLGGQCISETTMLTILGAILLSYACYCLTIQRAPRLTGGLWAYPFGFVAGLLGGAYNTDGPPVVIYGNCRGWEPAAFKCNLQGFFMFNGALIITARAIAGDFTGTVWWYYLFALPGIALGGWLGLTLDRKIQPAVFRTIILWVLAALGLKLVICSLATA